MWSIVGPVLALAGVIATLVVGGESGRQYRERNALKAEAELLGLVPDTHVAKKLLEQQLADRLSRYLAREKARAGAPSGMGIFLRLLGVILALLGFGALVVDVERSGSGEYDTDTVNALLVMLLVAVGLLISTWRAVAKQMREPG